MKQYVFTIRILQGNPLMFLIVFITISMILDELGCVAYRYIDIKIIFILKIKHLQKQIFYLLW